MVDEGVFRYGASMIVAEHATKAAVGDRYMMPLVADL